MLLFQVMKYDVDPRLDSKLRQLSGDNSNLVSHIDCIPSGNGNYSVTAYYKPNADKKWVTAFENSLAAELKSLGKGVKVQPVVEESKPEGTYSSWQVYVPPKRSGNTSKSKGMGKYSGAPTSADEKPATAQKNMKDELWNPKA